MTDQLTVSAPRGVARSFAPDALMGEWIASMTERVAAGELADNTLKTYARGMRHFLAWFGEQDTYRNITPRAIRSYKVHLRGKGHNVEGVNVRLGGVKAFFRWAVGEKGLAYDPAASVKGASRRGRRRHQREALTDQEVLRVLAVPDASTPAGKRDSAMLHLMAYCGLRQAEVQRASVGDLSTVGDNLRLMVFGKGHVEPDEPVYLAQGEMLEAMYSWLAVHPEADDPQAPLFCGLGNRNGGGPLTTRWIRGMVKDAFRQAGIRDARKTTHSLRHSLVSNLLRHGATPVQVMTVTRHRSLDTLLNYAHELARDTNPVEKLVDYGDGKGST